MNRVTVRICTGTTCFLMGSQALEALEDHLPEAIKPWVEVLGSPCLGCCKDANFGGAPYVEVNGEIVPSATLSALIACVEKHVRSEVEV